MNTIHPLTEASSSGDAIRQIHGLFFAIICQRSRINTLRTTNNVYAITWSSVDALEIMKWIRINAHCGRTNIKRIILAFSFILSIVTFEYYS